MVGVAALAGCTGSSDDGDDSTDADNESGGSDDTDTEATTTDEQDGQESVSGSPEDTVRGYVEASAEADDSETVATYFHRVHPFHPDNLDEDADEWLLTDREIESVETEVAEDAEATVDAVMSAPLMRMSEVERDTVADVLDGGRAAVVDATVTYGDGETTEFRSVTVASDGEWVVLAQGIEAGEGSDGGTGSSELEARVVDRVTFNTEEDSARVYLVDSPVADSVSVEAENRFSGTSTDTPDPVSYLSVYLDPAGDAVLVSATVDGESRPVHREGYPPSERVVDGVTFDDDPETDLYDATARVEFTGNAEGDRLAAESTVAGGEASTDSPSALEHATVGVDPDGDEVVVTLTADGEGQVVHRERYHP
ncbi:hypothetical protein [Halostella litorea]|uniref:hypothetical protein n=1 Tax=Halostella litorea TaxID=2528831 RepID=UPI001092FD69|nr:hypothetical protein [Halostella litorea]